MDSVLDLVSFIQDEKHKGSKAVALFLDITRVFHTVSQVHVPHGLHKLGIRERVVD